MNGIGFPSTDLYSEHEHGGEESFWPSFTDIMMVIVMTFLLITVAVILNNWELINNLQASVTAERQAMAKAQSALQVVEAKSKENETLEERMVRLESLLASRTQDLQKLNQQQLQTQQALEESKQLQQQTSQALQESEQQQQQTLQALQESQQLQQQTSQALQDSQQLQEQTSQALQDSQQQVESTQATIQNLQQESETQATELASVQQALDAQKLQVASLQKQKDESVTASQNAKAQLVSVNEELEKTGKELELLRQKDVDGHERLASLQGEYDQLDKKYQKLLKPARSTKNKHVVRVTLLKRNGSYSYQLSDEGQSVPETVNRTNLDKKLTALKEKYADDLYVKIIIPESSSVSHSDAWKFTSEILKRYDYYHSEDKSE